jgi:TatD DNase family protein
MDYIDIHSHIYFPDYDTDREEVISRARNANVGVINVGTDLESSKKSIALAETHENMWATIGLHPVDANERAVFDYDAFKKLALHPKVVGIGECGLDYFHAPFDAGRQREIFIRHIELANEVKKPLMLHVRNAKNPGTDGAAGNAYEEAAALLKEHAKVPFNFHFFAGTSADL